VRNSVVIYVIMYSAQQTNIVRHMQPKTTHKTGYNRLNAWYGGDLTVSRAI
jgi:hypothetical protein